MWPTYTDPLSRAYPTALRASVLLMNGGVDSNTPIGYAFHAAAKLAAAATAGTPRPRLLTWQPGKHIILLQVPGGAAVR